MSSKEELPFALAKWLKAQKEKEIAHKSALISARQKHTEQHLGFICELILHYKQLTLKQKQFINTMVDWAESGRVFTIPQMNSIGNLYYSIVMMYGRVNK